MPEVDLFVSIKDYDELWRKIDNLVNNKNENDKLSYKHRVLTTGDTMAYLKIAEGCSNYCTYCAIPYIQGKYISRKYEDILDEANMLAKKGIQELVVIAQDTTKYGLDLYDIARLPELLNDLCKIDGIKWIRFLYSYPESITDELIEVVKNNDKICKYFDLPIQHISDEVLKKMNRKSDGNTIRNLISKLRTEIPNVILRTTLITGFPGETEEDFSILKDNLRKWKFDRLGCFIFSPEEGTPAYDMPDQIDEETKQRRYDEIYELQKQISGDQSKKRLGTVTKVNICSVSDDGIFYVGRSYGESPEVDPVIYIASQEEELKIGEFYDVKIVDCSDDYDMTAVTI